MNINISVILLVILGMVGLFYKGRAEDAEKDSLLGKTEGQDKILKEDQASIEKTIADASKNIEDLYREHKIDSEEDKTKQERADEWNKK